MHKYALLLLLFSSITSISQNCNNTLSGKVTDHHDGSLLAGATLTIVGSEQTVLTTINGEYSFSNLCGETYKIQVSHPFCLTQGFTVDVSGDVTENFKLEHHIEELNQITIKGKNYSSKSKTILQNTLSKKELERFSNKTLGDALNSLSGVSSLNTGSTIIKPMINGLHSSRVVIINNGVRMEDQEWGSEHAPNIDINTIGNLSLIKGASALQYSGDAVGGVIIAEVPKIALKDSIYGKTLLTSATNGRGVSISTLLTKSNQKGWYTSLQGTLKRFGDFEAPSYILSNTGIYEQNASFDVGYKNYDYGFSAYYSFFKNEIGILRASHLGGAEDQIRALSSNIPLIINEFTYEINEPKQDISHHLARIKGFKRIDKLGKINFQYDYQKNNRLEFDIRRGDDSDKASLDLELSTHTILVDIASRFTNSTQFKSGIMTRFQENFADPTTGVRRLIPDYTKYDMGIYSILEYQLNDHWLLEVGGRFDYTYMNVFKFYRTSFWELRSYDALFPELIVEKLTNQLLTNPQLHFYNSSGTFGSVYTFGEDFKLYVNYSVASRAPNPSELFSEGLHHSASRIELGDLRFTSEIGHKISFTLQKENERFNFSINPYINSISDFIVIEPTGVQQTIRGNFQVWEYRQTNAQLAGLDLDATYNFANNFRFRNQFSFVKGIDKTKNEPLINMPPANLKNEIIYENPKFHNIRLSIQSEYNFRQNEFPENNFEIFLPTSESMELVDLSTPPNAYHLLNFNSSIDLKTTKNTTLNLGISISNIANTRYRNYLNRLRYYADDLGRNFLLNIKINY